MHVSGLEIVKNFTLKPRARVIVAIRGIPRDQDISRSPITKGGDADVAETDVGEEGRRPFVGRASLTLAVLDQNVIVKRGIWL